MTEAVKARENLCMHIIFFLKLKIKRTAQMIQEQEATYMIVKHRLRLHG